VIPSFAEGSRTFEEEEGIAGDPAIESTQVSLERQARSWGNGAGKIVATIASYEHEEVTPQWR